MKHFFLLIAIVVSATQLYAQGNETLVPGDNGNVYAIVVGISKYENPGIPALSYAHRDAEVFTEYLTSRAGGSVPQEHIRTLLNEQATYAAIYDALAWLLETCKENDLVYFYFSGHGDMENNTIYKLGFLLSYNSPRTNYLNSAVRIEDLNNFANTLSIKAKTKVVLITDACHSGDLAGKGFRASMLVGQQLRAFKEKEIRITSCAPDQLSVEDEGWGGGRGVFSYYLVNGLRGGADRGKDGMVSVSEIRIYLDSMMANDALLAQKAHLQNPAITGNEAFTLARVDKDVAKRAEFATQIITPAAPLRPLPKSIQSYFFDALEMQLVEEAYDFEVLNRYTAAELPFAFITHVNEATKQFITEEQLSELRKSLLDNPDALKKFSNKLVVLLSDRGQAVINAYLSGDEAELEKRRYYNSNTTNYDHYPKMFAVALKLAQPGSYLADILEVKYYYFTGVAARLKIPLVADPKVLIATALNAQLKALSLENNAAYVHNELGVLYSAKNDLAKALRHFSRAAEIAPTWSIPFSNLSGIYLEKKDELKAMESVQRSLELQPANQGAYLGLASLYEYRKNLLSAEEYFRTSIALNTRHYLPFERLAHIYLQTTDYALADSFFYEADKRKQGYHFINPRHMRFPKPLVESLTQEAPCLLDTKHITPSDAPGNFAWGMMYFVSGDMDMAEDKLRQSLRADSTSPLAWHYLGKILYGQEKWLEADVMFSRALVFYLDTEKFEAYLDRLLNRPHKNLAECIRQIFKSNYYEAVEDRYFLASLYESWGHFAAAETQYQIIIKHDSTFVGGYQKLWTLYENLGRYADAEQVLKNFMLFNRSEGEKAFFDFLSRMIDKFPQDKYAYFKAANFLYHLVAAEPAVFVHDQKVILPDTDEEILVSPLDIPPFSRKTKLPGTGEELPSMPAIVRPLTKGVNLFLVADSLFEDDATRAEINYKTGDLYAWQGLTKRAIIHFRKSVELQPQNADTRIKLIRSLSMDYKLGEAMVQLDSLQNRRQLNFDMQILLAKYAIHASRFAAAEKLLNTAVQVYPYDMPVTLELQGRLHTLKKQGAKAIAFYNQLLSLQPQDPVTLYSIARMQAQTNQERAAKQTLKLAIRQGFNYAWVLKEDNSWGKYRSRPYWKSILNSMSPKLY